MDSAPERIPARHCGSSYSDRWDSFLLLLETSGLRRRLSAIITARAIKFAFGSGCGSDRKYGRYKQTASKKWRLGCWGYSH
jgi:hypothetical protein